MNHLTARQIENNSESSNSWERYEPHRNRVTSLLSSLCPDARASLTILGAGNCNDLDLPELTRLYSAVHLVDIDGSALRAGVSRQNISDSSGIHLHADCDVTGLYSELAESVRMGNAGPEEIDRFARKAADMTVPSLPPPGHVTASLGLLSQLIESVGECFGLNERSIPLIQAVRRRHLRLLVEQTRPGGRILLVSEFVSSDTAPALLTIDDERLPGLVSQLLAQRNVFSGLHPQIVTADLAALTRENTRLCDVAVTAPWKWTFFSRTYAVFALTARRETSEVPG